MVSSTFEPLTSSMLAITSSFPPAVPTMTVVLVAPFNVTLIASEIAP